MVPCHAMEQYYRWFVRAKRAPERNASIYSELFYIFDQRLLRFNIFSHLNNELMTLRAVDLMLILLLNLVCILLLVRCCFTSLSHLNSVTSFFGLLQLFLIQARQV